MEFHGITITSWEVQWNSMKFHGILLYNQIPWNSMEFYGISMPSWEVPWNSMKLRKFHGTWSDTKFHGIPWYFSAAKWTITKFHRIPWNSGAAKSITTEFHGIQWNFEIVISIDTRFPWTSVKLNWNRKITFRLTSGSSWELYGIFHGIPWNSCFDKSSITEFRGIPWNKEGAISNDTGFHGIPWNSMELWCCQIKYNLVQLNSMEGVISNDSRVPWNSMEYSMEFHGTLLHGLYEYSFNVLRCSCLRLHKYRSNCNLIHHTISTINCGKCL